MFNVLTCSMSPKHRIEIFANYRPPMRLLGHTARKEANPGIRGLVDGEHTFISVHSESFCLPNHGYDGGVFEKAARRGTVISEEVCVGIYPTSQRRSMSMSGGSRCVVVDSGEEERILRCLAVGLKAPRGPKNFLSTVRDSRKTNQAGIQTSCAMG
ncbi:hypothetical protein FQN49_001678 [Arthroderma sp. PD_2]|nr:hypothetical protein FQN49_001678 [Arthroderma sp. PD_2]